MKELKRLERPHDVSILMQRRINTYAHDHLAFIVRRQILEALTSDHAQGALMYYVGTSTSHQTSQRAPRGKLLPKMTH